MFCPQCGQQQTNEAMRFCPRCGFPLGGVAALLEAGGAADGPGAEGGALTRRQRGVRKGLLTMAGAFVFGLLALFLTTIKEDLFVLIVLALFVLVGGLMRALYALLLEDNEAQGRHAPNYSPSTPLRDAPQRAALPHARSIPADAYARSPDTAEMARQQPSITDSTTKLLDEK